MRDYQKRGGKIGTMNIETPKGWRKGQAIFNFLWFLLENGYPRELGVENGRLADSFSIPNEELDKLYKEFLELHK